MALDERRSVNPTFDPFTINPFAEALAAHTNSGAQGPRGLRRRTSGSGTDHNLPTLDTHPRYRKHTYASSEGNIDHLHPLRTAGLTTGFNVESITRPHLSRIVNVGTLVDAPPVESDVLTELRAEEKDVLVHKVCYASPPSNAVHSTHVSQISPGDSLAGVSLKYGIPMADLRRTNQLWASDSIHLRTVLYVPIDQATRVRKLPTDSNLVSVSLYEDFIHQPEASSDFLNASESQSTTRLFNTGTIQRVPTSQLSFFPPSSTNKIIPEVGPIPQARQDPLFAYANQPRPSSYPSQSLTSLLTALPIAASTRDTIISRLSFESVSSSYSDRENEGVHEDLELDDVVKYTTQPHNHIFDERQATHTIYEDMATPKASHRSSRFGEFKKTSTIPTI